MDLRGLFRREGKRMGRNHKEGERGRDSRGRKVREGRG